MATTQIDLQLLPDFTEMKWRLIENMSNLHLAYNQLMTYSHPIYFSDFPS
jgi:hypothetical protein